jgi:hypothetical protein
MQNAGGMTGHLFPSSPPGWEGGGVGEGGGFERHNLLCSAGPSSCRQKTDVNKWGVGGVEDAVLVSMPEQRSP